MKKAKGMSSYLEETIQPVSMRSTNRHGIDGEVHTASVRGILREEKRGR